MKRTLALFLALALWLCGASAGLAAAPRGDMTADEIRQYVESLGFEPVASENEAGAAFCALHEAWGSAPASLAWADEATIYAIDDGARPAGLEKTLAELYAELVGLREWPAAWIDDGRPEGPRVLLGYNAPIDGEPEAAFESLDAYARAVQARAADTGDAAAITYVLNMNTHKMHYPDCSSVSQIKDTNRKDFSGTREEAIAMGYVPCKRCNP